MLNYQTVPPKGCPYGWDDRNGHLGSTWNSMSEQEKKVFDAKVFRHFSKIPIAYDGEDDGDDDVDEETSMQELISPDNIALYQPLYEKLVNHEKVKLITSGKITDHSSDSYHSITKHIQRINSEVSNAVRFPY